MSFQSSADSLAARLHLGSQKKYLVLGLVLAVLAALAVVVWTSCSGGGFSIERVAADGQVSATGEASDAASSLTAEEDVAAAAAQDDGHGEGGELACIHVGGAVASPGVYEVAAGSRVRDAVQAAGGLAEDAASDAINLARTVVDGEQIIVPTVEEYESGRVQGGAASAGSSSGASASAGASATAARVNINTASADELVVLPGIGDATAEKIVADRKANGPFTSAEDLKRVSGIGDKRYEQLADLICVG